MTIRIQGAREHNLQGIDLEIGGGLTAVTGISGSGKTSLVFDTLYHEARRRFLDVYTLGRAAARLAPAEVDAIAGLGPAVAVGQNLLNRNPASTLATASGLHPFLRLLYANFGERGCPRCGHFSPVLTEDEILARLVSLSSQPGQGDIERLRASCQRGVGQPPDVGGASGRRVRDRSDPGRRSAMGRPRFVRLEATYDRGTGWTRSAAAYRYRRQSASSLS